MILANRSFPKGVVLTLCFGISLIGAIPVLGVDSPADEAAPHQKPIPQNGVITASGNYFLPGDLHVDRSPGIEINADEVNLDFRGHALRFTSPPRPGTYGIVANGRKGIVLSNGIVGGFWFNVHCTQNENLRIGDMKFDDIPYLAINVAQSKDVAICDSEFTNFGYSVPKDEKSHYVIGINIGAKDAVISNNRFAAEPKKGTAKDVNIETVFVLFSANLSQKCLVAQNEMTISEVLPRSYGVWVATHAQATIAYNRVHNLKYGVCLGSDATALVCFNDFAVDTAPEASAAVETFGIQATGAKEIFEKGNTYQGVSTPTALPENHEEALGK
ncbi:hypothetical protein OAS39_03375 [Pirellulales bacterium]|nr:hypothetical protein [Pirellulales bacterium]